MAVPVPVVIVVIAVAVGRSAMLGLLSRVLAFFWRRAEGDEGGDVRRRGAGRGSRRAA